MAATLLLLTLTFGLALFLLYTFIAGIKFSKKAVLLIVAISITIIALLFVYTGADKIHADINRVIRNSMPKKSEDVYELLFKKPADRCVTVVNFKDQVIPKIDCCIWMELKLCPIELKRVLALRKYQRINLKRSDSSSFLNSFRDRPAWWTPQTLGDNVVEYTFRFNQDNQQIIFFSEDSSHVFLCDEAL